MLVLTPSPLSQTTPLMSVLAADLPIVHRCTRWIVETPKAARAALKTLEMPIPIRELEIVSIKEAQPEQLKAWLQNASPDKPVGLMSDAGCPGIADPGAEVVNLAHQLKCRVLPLVGPSSITLGLMASGLNGQNFHFWGYPPVNDSERDQWIEDKDQQSHRNQTTQIVIETPFRNQKLFDALIRKLNPSTKLCVASDLTGANMKIATKPILEWQKRQIVLEKQPTLFLWLSN